MKYEEIPQYLRGKIQLYYNIYKYLESKEILPLDNNKNPYTLANFL